MGFVIDAGIKRDMINVRFVLALRIWLPGLAYRLGLYGR
jgi:hypothetical protein